MEGPLRFLGGRGCPTSLGKAKEVDSVSWRPSSGALLLQDLRLSPAPPEPRQQLGHRAGAAAALTSLPRARSRPPAWMRACTSAPSHKQVPSRARARPGPTGLGRDLPCGVAPSVNHRDRRKKSKLCQNTTRLRALGKASSLLLLTHPRLSGGI